MIKFLKKNRYIVVFSLLSIIISFFYGLERNVFSPNPKQAVIAAEASLPVLTEKEIKDYNGDDPNKPIYIGLGGFVYDVSAGRDFYKLGGSYHDLAGRDSTEELKIFGGEIIKRKYPIVAKLK